MVAQGLHAEARNLLESALKVIWDPRLIAAYREVAASEGTAELVAQIEHCETWLAQYPTDPELSLTMGVLCLKQKLWGKAERHLEQALFYAVDVSCLRAANLKLAQLQEELGAEEKAAEYYRACALVDVQSGA